MSSMTIINHGTRVVNNYLVSTEIGYILIDTGYAGGFPHFMKQLRKHGIDPKDGPETSEAPSSSQDAPAAKEEQEKKEDDKEAKDTKE